MKRSSGLCLLLCCGMLLTCSTGCPVTRSLPAPGQLLTQKEPDRGRTYYLYVPSNYTDQRRWPLVVACHGTIPFDPPQWEVDEWKGLGEEKGFLVVAPELVGTVAAGPQTSVQDQIRRQMEDEQAILSAVQAVRAARSIDDARIFLTGWSAGGYAILFTGLRHPEIFRAIAVRQGNFNAAFLEPCVPYLDRYQPVLIMYGNIDFLRGDALNCIDWLRAYGLDPTGMERPGAHRRDPDPEYSFFADCVRHRPWIRILIGEDRTDAMTVSFSLRCSFEPGKYLWDFGDGERSPVATPTHRYTTPGTYNVRVAVYAANRPYIRQIQLQVPRVRLGTRPASASRP